MNRTDMAAEMLMMMHGTSPRGLPSLPPSDPPHSPAQPSDDVYLQSRRHGAHFLIRTPFPLLGGNPSRPGPGLGKIDARVRSEAGGGGGFFFFFFFFLAERCYRTDVELIEKITICPEAQRRASLPRRNRMRMDVHQHARYQRIAKMTSFRRHTAWTKENLPSRKLGG